MTNDCSSKLTYAIYMPNCTIKGLYLCVYARAYVTLSVTPVGFHSVNQCWFAKSFTVALGELENACCLAYETFSVKMRLKIKL